MQDLTPCGGRLLARHTILVSVTGNCDPDIHVVGKFAWVNRMDQVVKFSKLHACATCTFGQFVITGCFDFHGDGLARRLGDEHFSPQPATGQEVEVDGGVQGRAHVYMTADVGDPGIQFADDGTLLDRDRVFEV